MFNHVAHTCIKEAGIAMAIEKRQQESVNKQYYSFSTFFSDHGSKKVGLKTLANKAGGKFKVFQLEDKSEHLIHVQVSRKILENTDVAASVLLKALKEAGDLSVQVAQAKDQEGNFLVKVSTTPDGVVEEPILQYCICKDAVWDGVEVLSMDDLKL